MKKNQSKILNLVKKCADKEISKTVDGKCFFYGYQPKIPANLKKCNK